MTRRIPRSTRSLLATVAAGAIVLAACGSSDDDDASSTTAPAASEADSATADATTATTVASDAAPATTEAAASADATTDATTADEPDVTIVSDISDMPQECVDLLVETLQLIEPTVSQIDWETATMTDFQSLTTEFQTELDAIDTRTSEAGCDQYDFTSDEESLAAAIDLAEEEAPGTVGWLEFIGQLSMDTTSSADAPQDCASAIAVIDALIAEGKSMMSIPLGDMSSASAALSYISSECTPEESAAFFAREDVTAFLQ